MQPPAAAQGRLLSPRLRREGTPAPTGRPGPRKPALSLAEAPVGHRANTSPRSAERSPREPATGHCPARPPPPGPGPEKSATLPLHKPAARPARPGRRAAAGRAELRSPCGWRRMLLRPRRARRQPPPPSAPRLRAGLPRLLHGAFYGSGARARRVAGEAAQSGA